MLEQSVHHSRHLSGLYLCKRNSVSFGVIDSCFAKGMGCVVIVVLNEVILDCWPLIMTLWRKLGMTRALGSDMAAVS